MSNIYIDTLAETTAWIADERIKNGEPYKNRNSAIHAVQMEVTLELMQNHMTWGRKCQSNFQTNVVDVECVV